MVMVVVSVRLFVCECVLLCAHVCGCVIFWCIFIFAVGNRGCFQICGKILSCIIIRCGWNFLTVSNVVSSADDLYQGQLMLSIVGKYWHSRFLYKEFHCCWRENALVTDT